ncbi:hypothetical protein S140_128 [Shewanella sp. phage 1/40]|uniref:hypothetical protein n=1 Tax=Shewanella sp. phage 1/40 TaxID=1458860 RepID=UPI0004F5C83B|nr:hypothetical protein S140_128 [Shewanella sp. phage 1/40]AHK11535.1 hypothetical protein S140_128 [Shewanella sp. phage 1/40]
MNKTIAAVALTLATIVAAPAAAVTLSQTYTTGNSSSNGSYNNESITHVKGVNKSWGKDTQTGSMNNCTGCGVDNTVTDQFSKVVRTDLTTVTKQVGVESANTSFCDSTIGTDNLLAGQSRSHTDSRSSGSVDSTTTGSIVENTKTWETSTNGGAENGGSWGREVVTTNVNQSYSGTNSSSSHSDTFTSFIR